jgi:hypothetical protein
MGFQPNAWPQSVRIAAPQRFLGLLLVRGRELGVDALDKSLSSPNHFFKFQ